MRGHRQPAVFFVVLLCFGIAAAAPLTQRDGREVVFVPAKYVPFPLSPTNLRGPLSFIGDWINQSEWFPVELNIPDSFAAIGNGIQNVGSGIGAFTQNVGANLGNFAQGVGTNFGNFAQNLGQNWNNIALNVGNRFHNISQNLPVLTNFYDRPVAMAQRTKFGTKYIVVLPNKNNVEVKSDLKFDPFENDDVFTTFP